MNLSQIKSKLNYQITLIRELIKDRDPKMHKRIKFNKIVIMPLIINVLILILLSLISYPKYELDIDIMMQSLVYGIQGEASSISLVFSNTFIGIFLKGLMSIAPSLPWYTIFHYVCIFSALFLISGIFLKENPGILGKLTLGVFLVFSGYECYIRISYLKTSAILCAAAIYLLFYLTERDIKSVFLSMAAALGILMSSMISWTGFLITGGISLLCLASYIFIKEPRKLLNKQVLVILAVSIIGSIGARIVDTQVYKAADEWKDALKYRSAIEKVSVFGAAEYSDNFFETLGLEEEQYSHLVNGIYVCADQRGLDLVQEVAKINKELGAENILDFFRIVPIRLFQVGMSFCFAILWGLSYFSKKKDKKKNLIICIGILFAAYMILYMVNAWDNVLVGVLIFFPLCVLALMNCKDVEAKETNYITVYLLVLVLVLYNNFSHMLNTTVGEDDVQTALEWQIGGEVLSAVDLNGFLKGYSAYVAYPKGLIDREELKIVNGNYGIFPGYDYITRIDKFDIWNGVWWQEYRNIEDIFIE